MQKSWGMSWDYYILRRKTKKLKKKHGVQTLNKSLQKEILGEKIIFNVCEDWSHILAAEERYTAHFGHQVHCPICGLAKKIVTRRAEDFFIVYWGTFLDKAKIENCWEIGGNCYCLEQYFCIFSVYCGWYSNFSILFKIHEIKTKMKKFFYMCHM